MRVSTSPRIARCFIQDDGKLLAAVAGDEIHRPRRIGSRTRDGAGTHHRLMPVVIVVILKQSMSTTVRRPAARRAPLAPDRWM